MSSRAEKLLVAVALQAGTAGMFAVAQRLHDGASATPPSWLVTRLDASIPFLPASVWLYASWYVAPAIIVPLERIRFRRAAAAVGLAFVMCAIGWMLIPAVMQRPTLDDRAGASAELLRRVYALDPPSNLFPSFHAALAAVIVRVAPVTGLALGAVVAWMGAICVACLLTKQHYVLDIVAGVIAGAGAAAAVEWCADYLPWLRGPRRALTSHQTSPTPSTVASRITSDDAGTLESAAP